MRFAPSSFAGRRGVEPPTDGDFVMKTPRQYQIEAEHAVKSNLANGIKKMMVVLPTGTGKTYTAVKIVSGFKRIIWLTHTEELLDQSGAAFLNDLFPEAGVQKRIDAAGGLSAYIKSVEKQNLFADATDREIVSKIGIVKAEVFDINKDIVMASMQTLHKRLDRINAESFDAIICDECHLSAAKTYVKSINHFKPKLLLGLSVGRESFIELKGGVFKNGFVGSIGDAWNAIAENHCVELVDGGYETIKLKGILSRGWDGKKFKWKKVKTFIRHTCDKECMELTVGGDNLALTRDHSVYIAKEGVSISEEKTENLSIKNIAIYDTGFENNGDTEIDVFDILPKIGIPAKIHVSVDLTGISHETFKSYGINWKKKWELKNKGRYGHHLPLEKYMEMKHILPCPQKIYCEGARGLWIEPKIKLSEWAYFIGFFYGDGWFSERRIGLAVGEKQHDEIKEIVNGLKNVKIRLSIRKMKGKSYEFRISNTIFTSILKYFIQDKSCYEKTINPSFILEWTRKQRMELLNGLINSDGHLAVRSRNRKRYYYTTTSGHLGRTLLSLLRSMDIQGYMQKRKQNKNSGGIVDGRKINSKQESYTIHWSYFSTRGDNKGHKGQRCSFDHGDLLFNEAPIRKIKNIARLDWVYDFEMDGHPSFVANGILVHNTATPHRADGASLGDIYDEICYQYSLFNAINDGYLCELDAIACQTDLSLDDVHTMAGDLNQKELRQTVNTPQRNKFIVERYKQYADGLQNLVFAVDVQHAQDICQAFKDAGYIAEFIVGDEELTPDRREMIDRFKTGKTTILVNVQILTAGFDYPGIKCLTLACPTKSLTKFFQQIGRCTRPLTGVIDGLNTPEERKAAIAASGKPKAIVLDIVDTTSRHRIVNTWTLDKTVPIEQKTFVTTAKRGQLFKEEEERKESVRKLEATRKKDERINLFAMPEFKQPTSIKMTEPATQPQLDWLKRLGYDVVNNTYTKGSASAIISGLPAAPKEIKEVRALGYDAPMNATKGEIGAAKWEAKLRAEAEAIKKAVAINADEEKSLPF